MGLIIKKNQNKWNTNNLEILIMVMKMLKNIRKMNNNMSKIINNIKKYNFFKKNSNF